MTDILKFHESVIELPSLGKGYSPALQARLIGGTSVKVKDFVMGERRAMKKLIGSSMYDMYKTLTEMLVVEPKDVNFDELFISDMLTILYAVFIPSFGPTYPIEFTCGACETKQTYEFDVSKLMVKNANEVVNDKGECNYKSHGIEFTTPRSNHVLTCHLLSLEDEKTVASILADYTRLNKLVDEAFDTNTMRLLSRIDTIDGERLPNTSKFELLMNWSETDHQAVEQFLDTQDTGPVFDQLKTKCKNLRCKRPLTLDLPPPSPEFFRPQRRATTA